MKLLIVLPAYNEQELLERSVDRVIAYCRQALVDEWQIIISDNHSTDATAEIGKRLAAKYPQVEYLYVATRGKGAAIRAAWQQPADVYCFMDADLATELSALPAALEKIRAGFDLAVGSRMLVESHVERSMLRRVISTGYRLVLQLSLGLYVTDAPCGFKAITREAWQRLERQIENNGWFFDSELLALAEVNGLRIAEVPVTWKDPREGNDHSRVRVVSLSLNYLRQVLRLRRRLKRRAYV